MHKHTQSFKNGLSMFPIPASICEYKFQTCIKQDFAHENEIHALHVSMGEEGFPISGLLTGYVLFFLVLTFYRLTFTDLVLLA